MTSANVVHTTGGTELVKKLAAEGERIFTTDRARQLAPGMGMSAGYVRQALHYLARSGWIVPLRRGLYALAPALMGATPLHEFEIAMQLAEPAAISHWSAMHHHGFTEQIPRQVFVLTTIGASLPRVRGRHSAGASGTGCSISGTTYKFIQVKPERYFGVDWIWIGEAHIAITDPERTLLDGLARPQYCGDFGEVLHAFEMRGQRLDLERITSYALRLDAVTARRLGWVLEQQGADPAQLEPLRRVPMTGYRVLDPTGPHRGPCDSRWMIQCNLPGWASE